MRTRVRDVMTRDTITVAPETTLREAAETFAEHHIAGAPVVTSDQRVVGVVSVSDLMEFLATVPGVPTERETSGDWDDGFETSEEIDEAETSNAWFLDHAARPAGTGLRAFVENDGPEWNVLERHTVDEVMNRRILDIAPDADVADAARAMLRSGVHRLLVRRNGRLEGVITTSDLLRVLAAGR